MNKKNKTDDMVNWVEPDIGFLPKEMDADQLVVFVKLLIMKVKEDHSRNTYNADVITYAKQIRQIFELAVKNGYVPKNYRENPDMIKKENGESESLYDETVLDA